MGAIRKTLSISTLGLVDWRSKKERLRRAETDLEITTKKEELLKQRLLAAEERAEAAEATALREARRGKRSRRLAGTLGSVRTAGSSVVDSTLETKNRVAAEIEPALAGATSDVRRRGRSARKAAEKRAAVLQAQTEKARKRAAKKSAKARKQLSSAAHDASTKVREKASDLTS